MSTKHLKRIGTGLAAGFVFAVLFSLYTATPPENTTITFKTQTHPTVNITSPRVRFESSTHPIEDAELKHFQNADFYRTIIDNNLFRPLGWKPPRPREPYRLIGTLIPTNANTPKQAILQRTPAGSTYTVTIGETLDKDTTVVDIASKQITLSTTGVQRSLKLNTTPLIK